MKPKKDAPRRDEAIEKGRKEKEKPAETDEDARLREGSEGGDQGYRPGQREEGEENPTA